MGYDAIIIGSGLGGCAAGAALTGAGKKVLILEQMDTVGGRCSGSERDGFRLDSGPHFLFGCEHGAFEWAASRVGKAGVLKFHHPHNLCLKIVDRRITVTAEKVTVEAPGMDTITLNLAEVLKMAMDIMPEQLMSMGLGMIGQAAPMITAVADPIVSQFDNVTVKEYFEKFVEWSPLRDFVEQFQCAGFGTPSGLTPVSELLRTILVMLEYFEPGMNPIELFGFPVGGLITIPKTICDGITEKGGEVRTGALVKKVVIEGGKAVGVELDGGEVVNAPVIISNVGIKDTVARLVGQEHFDSEYVKTVKDSIMGISCFVIHAALDTKITDMEGGFSISSPGVEKYFNELWYDRVIPKELPSLMWTVPSNMDPSTAPDGMQMLVLVGPMMTEMKDPYEKSEQMGLDAMEEVFPGFKEHIVWHDFNTPDTFLALGKEGAPAIGLAQCLNQVGENRPSGKSPIPGLFYCGADTGKNNSGIGCDMSTRSGLAVGDYVANNM